MPILRRDALILLGILATGGSRAAGPDEVTAAGFSFDRPDGTALPLSGFAGKPVLIVNTATACGLAPQFAGLQALWTRFGDRGLTVIAVPSPDFGDQEPLDGAAIAQAARDTHGVTFPVTDKAHVRGPSAHPFYRWAAARKPGESPQWNFHKYLVGRDGGLASAFASRVEPTDPRVISAIVAELPQD